MWRAESLKAGAGSRSKAKLLPCCERVVSECCSSGRNGVGGSVLSPWEPKTWCNRCRPSCRAFVSPAKAKPHPPPPPLPHCPVHCPCGAKRRLMGPWWGSDGTLMGVCMAYGPFTHVAERFACLCPQVPQREEPPPPPHVSLLRDASDVLLVKVTAECFLLVNKENSPFAVVRLLVVAAWLRCHAEILPPSCFLHSACRPRLAASFSCISLQTVTISDFNLLFLSFFTLCFLSFNAASLLCNLSPFPFYSYSFHSLLAWDSERKVALELWVWSLVELICWDRLQWEKIVYPGFPLFFCFILTQDIWLEKSGFLLCLGFFSLNQGKNTRKCCCDSFDLL